MSFELYDELGFCQQCNNFMEPTNTAINNNGAFLNLCLDCSKSNQNACDAILNCKYGNHRCMALQRPKNVHCIEVIDFLISGYIKSMINNNENEIPLDLVDICFNFYYNNCICLEPICNLNKISPMDPCPICYSELQQKPVTQLKCSHFFHFECIIKWIEDSKNNEIRIGQFEYLQCKACAPQNKMLSIAFERSYELKNIIDSYMQFKQQFEQNIVSDIKCMGIYDANAFAISQQSMIQFALDHTVYYKCFECKQPYFGGTDTSDIYSKRDMYFECLYCVKCVMKQMKNETIICRKHDTRYWSFMCDYCKYRIAVLTFNEKDLLVFGYIRMFAKYLSCDANVIKLIRKFYSKSGTSHFCSMCRFYKKNQILLQFMLNQDETMICTACSSDEYGVKWK
eukprot:441605_1